MARSGAGHPSKAGEQYPLPFRQNRPHRAWPCLRELDPLSSSTKRVDLRAETRVHALRRGRTIPIIDTQRPAASCNTVSVTSSPETRRLSTRGEITETSEFCDSGVGGTDHKGEGCRKNLSLNENILL